MGFGDNDHAIRELMRFIEMTSRRFIKEDVIQNMTASSSKEVYFILYFEFEYRKSRTTKGDTMLMIRCATKCSNFYKSILNSSQDSQLNTSILLAI